MAFFGRGRNKIQKPYTLKHTHIFYIEDIGDNPLYEVGYSEYENIISDYIKRIMDYMFEKNGEFDMGFRLGKCSIVKKHKTISDKGTYTVDWKLTNKLGKQIIHLNEHSGGFRYGFYWNRKKSLVANIKWYKLIFTRTNKRRLAKLIKSGKYDYYEKS